MEDCTMARTLLTGWSDFSLSKGRFQRIAEDFAAAMDDGLNARPSPLQMLPAFVGRPERTERGTFLALDFGGTNVRVAEVELFGAGKTNIKNVHKVALKNAAEGYDYTASSIHVEELFDFIALQVAAVSNGTEQVLGHSFSYACRQTSLARAALVGWTKEIKVEGLAGQDINGLLSDSLDRLHIRNVKPVAVLNDTTATLLAAAYALPDADMGSVCGTGHNTCYYEARSFQGSVIGETAYNTESGGFDKLPFSIFDEQLDADSEDPGSQRLEKMVAGRYLGELTRRILCSGRGECGSSFVEKCELFRTTDGLSSVDLATFAGDGTKDLENIGRWFETHVPEAPLKLSERHFIKVVAEMVVDRAAALIGASYAGFLRRIDPHRRKKHIIGINGSLYEKLPGFSAGIVASLATFGDWPPELLSFFLVEEAPLVGAALAAAMAKEGDVS